MESTVVDISITPFSFKPVSLSLSRISSILKTPKTSLFFNPINIYLNIFLPHTLFTVFYNYTFFRLTFKLISFFTVYAKNVIPQTRATKIQKCWRCKMGRVKGSNRKISVLRYRGGRGLQSITRRAF